MREAVMEEVSSFIKKSLKTIVLIPEINHQVCMFDIERLKTINDVLMHSASILSDVQEMLNRNYPKEQINSEINEAKWFIFKAMKWREQNPPCPLKGICPYYSKARELIHARP